MITICFTYFKSLTLANLDAALYSVRQQSFAHVKDVAIVDNDTDDSKESIQRVIDGLKFPVPVRLFSCKHEDPTKTHAWSSNFIMREAYTRWALFARADYLLRFDLAERFLTELGTKPAGWNGFVTSNGCHLHQPIEACEATSWRQTGPSFSGTDYDYTLVDAGVWMARTDSYFRVGGLDERLTAWGHAQTDFQHRLYQSGVEFARIPETLFWHPAHGGEKDINVAHAQLAAKGADLKEMWARYEGANPYASL